MKRKQILVSVIVVLCIGLGLYALTKRRSTGYKSGEDEESVPTVVSVQTGLLQPRTLHRYVTGYGMIEAAPATPGQPAAGAQLGAPSAGVVVKVNVVEGQHVEIGDLLVDLSPDSAKQEVERQKKLYAQHNTSLKALQDARAQLAQQQVISTVSGTVTRLNVRAGEVVDANTVVAEVVDLNRLAVSMQIPAAEAKDLNVGEEVQVLTLPPVSTTLSFVSPAVDPKTGAVPALALLPPGNGLHPGQFVSLSIVTAVHTNCLAAPEASVVTDESAHSVIAVVKGDQAVQVPVETGFREDGWVEVKGHGLKSGDTIVTIGAYGLPQQTKIRVANSAPDETSVTSSASLPTR